MKAEFRPSCGLEAALGIMGGKWKPLILYHISYEPRRFGELRRLVQGISEKMLIQQLRELQTDGIVARHDFQEVPPKVEYSITPFGETLAEALKPLCAWGTQHRASIEAATQARKTMILPQADAESA